MATKKKGLTPAERKRVKYVCDWEGFDYAFLMKTEFPEIKDPEFHRLRKAFCDAREALNKYIYPKGK